MHWIHLPCVTCPNYQFIFIWILENSSLYWRRTHFLLNVFPFLFFILFFHTLTQVDFSSGGWKALWDIVHNIFKFSLEFTFHVHAYSLCTGCISFNRFANQSDEKPWCTLLLSGVTRKSLQRRCKASVVVSNWYSSSFCMSNQVLRFWNMHLQFSYVLLSIHFCVNIVRTCNGDEVITFCGFLNDLTFYRIFPSY